MSGFEPVSKSTSEPVSKSTSEPVSKSTSEPVSKHELPIYILTCDRYDYTKKTMESIEKVSGLKGPKFYVDDASKDKRIHTLAKEYGYNLLHQFKTRQGVHAGNLVVAEHAEPHSPELTSWIFLTQNDWEWVKPFNLWDAMYDPNIWYIRPYGKYKEIVKGKLQRASEDDYRFGDRKKVVWREYEKGWEKGDIHFSGMGFYRVEDFKWVIENSRDVHHAGKVSIQLKKSTLRPKKNLVFHIGFDRTPNFKKGPKVLRNRRRAKPPRLNKNRIAFLLEEDMPLLASRYKYYEFFKLLREVKLFRNVKSQKLKLKQWKPCAVVVFGDKYRTFHAARKIGLPYILAEHDVCSIRGKESQEEKMIRGAQGIIFTSEEHQDYIIKKYRYPKEKTFLLYLRPLKKDLYFDPLPKKPGTLVYAGSVHPWSKRWGAYGYRAYLNIFKRLSEKWEVHLYHPRRDDLPSEYSKIGCIPHPSVPQDQLYKELSQYEVGYQGYNLEDVPSSPAKYALTCRPNKLWEYLAAGIPTLGFQGGGGMEVYNKKWGVALDSLDNLDINFPTITNELRFSEVMDNNKKKIQEWLTSIGF